MVVWCGWGLFRAGGANRGTDTIFWAEVGGAANRGTDTIFVARAAGRLRPAGRQDW